MVLGDRYKVHGYLTRGATARIYLAEDLVDGVPVAVKMLAPESIKSHELAARMLREADALRDIDHPNVVKVLDTGETAGGIPYLVLEALPGETLGDYLRRQGTPPFEVSLPLGGLDPMAEPDATVGRLEGMRDIGATMVNVNFRHRSPDHYVEQLEALAELARTI